MLADVILPKTLSYWAKASLWESLKVAIPLSNCLPKASSSTKAKLKEPSSKKPLFITASARNCTSLFEIELAVCALPKLKGINFWKAFLTPALANANSFNPLYFFFKSNPTAPAVFLIKSLKAAPNPATSPFATLAFAAASKLIPISPLTKAVLALVKVASRSFFSCGLILNSLAFAVKSFLRALAFAFAAAISLRTISFWRRFLGIS